MFQKNISQHSATAMGFFIQSFIALLLFVPVGSLFSEDYVFDLPGSPEPVEVQAKFELLDIQEIDDEAETFQFSGVLTLEWKDPRQSFDPEVHGTEEKFFHGDYQFNELEPGWYPQVVLANASEIPERQGILIRIKPDGTCNLIQDLHAVARTQLDLTKYPFDRQTLKAEFQVLGFDRNEVILTEMQNSGEPVTREIRVPEWHFAGMETAFDVNEISGRSNLLISVHVDRQYFFVLRLVIIPMVFIVSLSWCVFWMDKASLGDRMSVSFVGILTATTYSGMVSEIIPHISYYAFINAFLNFCFIVMCATAAMNIVVCVCDRQNLVALGNTIDRRSRWIFPLSLILLILIAVVHLLL